MSRRWQQLVLQTSIIVALVVGLRLILGGWNWWLTGIGVAGLLLSNLWSSRPGRGGETGPQKGS